MPQSGIVKYHVKLSYEVDGLVERADIIGAIFGQTEGLLGPEMNLNELQRVSKVGRIEVIAKSTSNTTNGNAVIPMSTDIDTCALISNFLGDEATSEYLKTYKKTLILISMHIMDYKIDTIYRNIEALSSTEIEEISDEPVEDQVETSDEPVEHQIEVSDESKEESEEVATKDSTELEDAAEDSKEEK